MNMRPEEFTTISVDLHQAKSNIVLKPLDHTALITLQLVLDKAPESLDVHSGGISGTNDNTINGAYLHFGGKYYRRTKGNLTRGDYEGSLKVYLDLGDVSNYPDVAVLRSLMWYGLRVDPTSTVENFLLVMAGMCKVCDNKLDDLSNAEWSICNGCATICDHNYTKGLGRTNVSISHMVFCKICGRAHPDWKPSQDPMKDMLATVTSGDLAALHIGHPDGSSTVITRQ